LDTPQEDLEERAHRLRHEAAQKGDELFQTNPDYSSALVYIHDREEIIENEASEAARERLTDERLEYLTRRLDARGEGFLRLVKDLDSEKAFAAVMDNIMRALWWEFGGFPIEVVLVVPPFAQKQKPPTQLQAERFQRRALHWIMEGHRRIDALRKQPIVQHGATVKRKALEPKPELLANLEISLSRLRAAEALGITPRTLDRWVKDNRLMPTGASGRKRFKAKDLKKFLDQKLSDNRDIK